MIKMNKLMQKLGKKYHKIYYFGLVILIFSMAYFFSQPTTLAQEADTNQESATAGSASQNYKLDQSAISPAGDWLQSESYKILTTFGEISTQSYESTNYKMQIGFPATITIKKVPGKKPEGQPQTPPIIEIPESTNTVIEDITNSINEQIDKVVSRLPAPVKKAIANTTAAVNKVVKQVRSNKQIMNTVNDVIEPTVVISTIVAVMAVVTSSSVAFELTNITYLIFRFGYFWLLPVSFGKKRKPWGVVFDSTTGRPIRGAIIRIFAREFDKLKESQITDANGRFGFLVDRGDYYVVVQKPGFIFPSSLITTAVISQYHNIYRGEVINIKEKREGILNINIPVDSERTQVTKNRIIWLRILNFLGIILEKINVPLLVAGTVVSWLILMVEPKVSNYIILLIYGVLLLLKVFLFRAIRRSWGQVLEADTNRPLEQTLIRIFNLQAGTLVATRVTNSEGQFTTLVNPGDYYLVATKPGYLTYQTKPVNVAKERGILRLTIRLKKEVVPQVASNMAARSY